MTMHALSAMFFVQLQNQSRAPLVASSNDDEKLKALAVVCYFRSHNSTAKLQKLVTDAFQAPVVVTINSKQANKQRKKQTHQNSNLTNRYVTTKFSNEIFLLDIHGVLRKIFTH